MSNITKFKKILDLSLGAVELPSSIKIAEQYIAKDIYLLDETFIPLIGVYSNFISNEIMGKPVFAFNFVKDSGNILGVGMRESDDLRDDTSNVVKMLFLMEGLNQVFPNNTAVLEDKSFYTDLIMKVQSKLKDKPEGSLIDANAIFEGVLKDSLYINLMKLENKNKYENRQK